MPHDHRGRGRLKNSWKIDPEKEILTAGYKYSWRKMKAAAQNRAEAGEEVVCSLCSTGSGKA